MNAIYIYDQSATLQTPLMTPLEHFCIALNLIWSHHFTLDLSRDTLVTGKQVVEIKHTLKEPRSLADPVRTTGHTMELHLRDICWSQANGEHRNISTYLCVYQLYCIRQSKYLIMVGWFSSGRPELHILVITFCERLFILPPTYYTSLLDQL